MSRQTVSRLLSVLSVMAMLLTGCAASSSQPAAASNTVSAQSSPVPLVSVEGGSGNLKLIPVDISATSAGGGWKDYIVHAAIENTGPGVEEMGVVFDSGDVDTQEGFTYHIDITDFTGVPRAWLPPKFRMSGLTFKFRAAESAHPTKVKFHKFGTIDLTAMQKPTFPTDEPRTSLHSLSDGLQTKRTKITFTQIEKAPTVGLDVVIENLDKGQDNNDAFPACSVFDAEGIPYGLDLKNTTRVGPGQTVKKTYYFTDNLQANQLGTAIMLCYNNYDYQTGQGTIDMFRLE